MQNKDEALGTQPIGKLMLSLALPAVAAQFINMLYNIVDRIYIGNIPGTGALALTGVGVTFPIILLVSAFAAFAGMGGAPLASIQLGAGNREGAEKILGNCFSMLLVLSVTLTVIFSIFKTPLLYMFGASDAIIGYAEDYISIYLAGTIFVQLALGLNTFISAQGHATVAMLSVLIGAVINIVLDPVFIFVFGMGVSGAALATAISQCISFGILFFQSLLRKDCVHLKPGKITLSLSLYGEILHGGIPSLCRQGVASIATAALNLAANPFGDAAIAALSIVSRYMMFIGSAMIGFGQGFQPVCGFNFGAKRYDRVLESFWFCVKVSAVFLMTLAVVSFIGAPQIMRVFRKEDLDVIEIGTWAMRFQCLTLPLSAWIVMSNMLTQTIGYGFRASFVAAGRQGLFLIPALFVLPVRFGIRGLQWCQPVADALTFVLGAVIVLGILKELKGKAVEADKEPRNVA